MAPAVLWMVVIFVLSAQSELPSPSSSLLNLLLKKGSHMAEYAVLAVLLYHALGPACPGGERWRYALAWALAVLYAATDEFHQQFVPGRGPSAWDVALDGSGALLGLVLRRLADWPLVARARVLAVRTPPR